MPVVVRQPVVQAGRFDYGHDGLAMRCHEAFCGEMVSVPVIEEHHADGSICERITAAAPVRDDRGQVAYRGGCEPLTRSSEDSAPPPEEGAGRFAVRVPAPM